MAWTFGRFRRDWQERWGRYSNAHYGLFSFGRWTKHKINFSNIRYMALKLVKKVHFLEFCVDLSKKSKTVSHSIIKIPFSEKA